MKSKLSPFEFSSYKEYLRAFLKESASRGLLARLANAAECQRPYLSKVLQTDSEVQLTPDHLYGICEFLPISDLEKEYLKLLLDKERASQTRFRESIEHKLLNLKNRYLNLKDQIGKEQLSSTDDSSSFYYSYWVYAALHIGVSIPSLQSVQALSRRFALSEEAIEVYLRSLEQLGLVSNQGGKIWKWKSGDIHLTKESPMVVTHHMNWRHQAVQNVGLKQADSTHYSVVQSLSKKDYEFLRLQMLESIKKFQGMASPSAPEELVCFNLDFFRVGI